MAVSRYQLFVVYIKPYGSIRAENFVYSKKKYNSLHNSLKPELLVFKAMSADNELGMMLPGMTICAVKVHYCVFKIKSQQGMKLPWGAGRLPGTSLTYCLPT